jgi:glucose-1-phosphate thymidylyltransferase
LRIACLEEIAYQQGFITLQEFIALRKKFEKSAYGQYLLEVARAKA